MDVGMILILFLVVAFGCIVFVGAPYVPSKRRELRRAFSELYPLSDKDVLVDLGSGDGVVLREAAKKGARAVGFELNPLLVGISWLLSRYDKRVSTRMQNAWTADFPAGTTVVYAFSVSRDIGKIERRVQVEATRLKRPIHIISYGFEIPGQRPVKTCGAHSLYVIKP